MIEDERGLVLSVGDRLGAEGYEFAAEARGDTGLARALAEPWDLYLVDVMLPGLDGFEIIRRLRQNGIEAPALLVTARDQVIDRVSGLRLGADDYVVKPFSMDELVARIETNLRRSLALAAAIAAVPAPKTGTSRTFGPFTFDPVRAGVFRNDERLPLTHQEFRLLQVFLENEGQVLEASKLLDLAWGYGSEITSRTLYVHMSWLRQKLKTAERPDGYIQTVRGFGYVFTA
jgi:DNA-binding response OmpR family regulator